mmetsp:Transcript_41889/g.77563  ORF Transcript_41889/g.77563 Transcript_41889/m.77563 type:complete len:237 (-) Transcript_41889:293-1003(-)
MAMTSVPQLIAYAETAGYASYRGLQTAGPSLVAWGLTTGSPLMTSGVTCGTALMAKADLNGEAYVEDHGEENYIYLISAYSIIVGLASITLAFAGFGKLAKRTLSLWLQVGLCCGGPCFRCPQWPVPGRQRGTQIYHGQFLHCELTNDCQIHCSRRHWLHWPVQPDLCSDQPLELVPRPCSSLFRLHVAYNVCARPVSSKVVTPRNGSYRCHSLGHFFQHLQWLQRRRGWGNPNDG